jgi:outer membrane protein assembly factor BamB
VEGSPPANKPLAFCVAGREPAVTLTCRDANTGDQRWQFQMSQCPTWAAYHGAGVFVGSTKAVLCLSQADGKVLWEFAAPAFTSGLASLTADGDLGAYHANSTSVLCLQGERRLLVLDADTGRVIGSHWAPGAGVRPWYPAGWFNSLFYPGEKWTVLQTGTGTQWVIDNRTGRLVHETAGGPALWLQPPLVVDQDQICMARDASHVVLLSPATGKDRWIYPASPTEDTTLLTGEPARVLGQGQTILVAVPLNASHRCVRLDPGTGAVLWSLVMRGDEAIEPARACLDGLAFYYAAGNLLWSRSLRSGALRWVQALPQTGSPWKAVRCGRWLVVCPADLKRRPRELIFPVLLYDPVAGELVQQLNFATDRPDAAVQLLSTGLVVGAGGQIWGLTGLR